MSILFETRHKIYFRHIKIIQVDLRTPFETHFELTLPNALADWHVPRPEAYTES